MSLRNKSLTDLTPNDCDDLVRGAVGEGTHIDFKSALVGGTSEDRKKFLADVCAFANAHGGELVLGIQENAAGAASAVAPLVLNPDAEILRLENMIADGLDPKLFGVRMRAVPYGGGHVLVIRVPKSVSGTHRSKADQHFYVRESRSNRQLDVPAIRTRFEGEMTRQTRLENYLAQRYAALLLDSTAMPMMPGPKGAVHIFPALRGFDDEQFNVSNVSTVGQLPVPTRPRSLDCRMSFEGPIHHPSIVDGRIRAFSLAHHFGIVEGVWKSGDPQGADTLISPEGVEVDSLAFVVDAIGTMRERLGVELPLLVRLAIVGGLGATIKSEDQRRYNYGDDMHLNRIDRSALVFPDVLITEWPTTNIAELFRPVFDRLWQTSGYVRSSMYKMREGQLRWQGAI
jgi:hypothetical protein